jgi:hypothetical protein
VTEIRSNTVCPKHCLEPHKKVSRNKFIFFQGLYEFLDQLADSEIVEYDGEDRKAGELPRQQRGALSRVLTQPAGEDDDNYDYYDDFDGKWRGQSDFRYVRYE